MLMLQKIPDPTLYLRSGRYAVMTGRPVLQTQSEKRLWKSINGGGTLDGLVKKKEGRQGVIDGISAHEGTLHPAILVSAMDVLDAEGAADAEALRIIASKARPMDCTPSVRASRILLSRGEVAAATEILGIHALLGAFLAGVVMPTNAGFRTVMMEKLEDIASVFFLPLSFAFMGLRTEIGLINTPALWGTCAALILMAIAGKLGGCALAARAVGQPWKNSLIIGTLMNTRGLMQLVVVNIGSEMGVIPPQVFVLLVLMALVTTFMTTPMLSLVEFLFKQHKRSHIRKLREERARNAQAPQQTGKLLLCFGRPDTGRKLLRVYSLLFGPRLGGHPLLAAHYTLGTDVNPANAEQFANESFLPITEEARKKDIDFEKIYRTTDSFINEAKQLIRTEQPDMILLGAGPRFMSSQEMPLRAVTPFFSLFRGKTESILAEAECTVGIYSSRKEDLDTPNYDLAILLGTHADDFLLDDLPNLLDSSPLSPEKQLRDIHIYRLKGYTAEEPGSHNAAYAQLAAGYSERIHLHPVEQVEDLRAPLLPESTALMLLSYETCSTHVAESPVFPALPSLLVLKKGRQ